ncbi:MAG: thiamine-phosphate kinase [Chloroflexi bacterium]|nr:thiamine-phosphate kinase [Chloroflexota bacterium]
MISKLVDGSKDARSPAWRNLVIGIGDDAAAWTSEPAVQIATIDSLNEGAHFSLDITTWRELGWKALAVNLSDIAAMGGEPRYALASLILPDVAVEEVAELYRGLLELAAKYGVAVAGGNISRGPAVSATVAVFGVSPDNRLLTRKAAAPGDKIAVTGWLGGAAGGLRVLRDELSPGADAAAYLRQAFLRPEPRLAEGRVLAEKGVRTAIDISDGLIADLTHICQASGVGARVEAASLPVNPLLRAAFGDAATGMALAGGEDYELLFTAPPATIDAVKAAAACPVTIIGDILPGKGVSLVDAGGRPVAPGTAGWDHFRS